MHCHSSASELSRLGVQRSLGLPECATPPAEVYELAKRRGMDFVTITDHDTIAGCLELADRPDLFISEELTASFKGEPQAVHVLCYGITPADHEWLQAHADDLESCAAYLHEGDITCALAHPFYSVDAPLTARHRRRLAELFPIWEVRNGSRARELNLPAAGYIETHGGTGIGGSDDHAGVDIGRTYTETEVASTPDEFLRRVRAGGASAGGEMGSAAKWAHLAIAVATRALALGGRTEGGGAPEPAAVLMMAERVMREGAARSGVVRADLGPADARALLEAWTAAMEMPRDPAGLIALMQSEGFSHTELYRRARRRHEHGLRDAVAAGLEQVARADYGAAAAGLFTACIPAIPYAPAAAFLGREKAKLVAREGEPARVAVIADGIGAMHGVTHTIQQIRELGVPGFEVEVIGTDPQVDRRLPAVAEIEVPFYEALQVGVPSLPAVAEALAEGRYDAVHLTSPGPAGIVAALIARIMEMPVVGSYHTELAAYAGLRSGDPALELGARAALASFYGGCDVVLSPSPAADASLREIGIAPERLARWERGVDTSRFDPAKRDPSRYPGRINVLYAGRLTKEKGADLLAESFLLAHSRDPGLHLLLAGGGPEEDELREWLGGHATFLGWLGGDDLARAYASADIFCFCSRTDTFGQVIVEAGASGLPVVAVAEGGPATLVRDGETGLLCPADSQPIAAALLRLAAAPLLRRRLGAAGISRTRSLSWEAAMHQLAAGYRRALAPAEAVSVRAA
jgi:glycosyltransferase involved in cell wall biosynthesis/predicted metal-dependent phosphoesterase TrpH